MSKQARADRVNRLLNDPDLQQAFEDVRKALHNTFENTPIGNDSKLVDIRKSLELLKAVEANLKYALQEGKLEEYRIEEQDKVSWLGDLKWTKRRA